jgi:hypothetical protein
MKLVRRYIQERQAAFAECSFFEELKLEEASPEALSFMSGLTFFVMAFQDILRLNEARVKDPALRAIARMHRDEDRGHDAWFLHDMLQVEGRIPDVREVFAAGHTLARDAAYKLVVEALRADDDRVSMALLLVLESTGNVFFGRVVEWLERAGLTDGLHYFARSHLDVEIGHELFEEHANRVLDAIVLGEDDRRKVIAAVDRCFDAITELIASLSRATAAPPSTTTEPPPASATVTRKDARPQIHVTALRRAG